MSDLAWPAIASQQGTLIAALLLQLERDQWLPPDDLLGLQLRQLRSLLAHAQRHSPFYRHRLAAREVTALRSIDALRELPLLTRKELRAAGETIHCSDCPPGHGDVATLTTSGTTGPPLSVRTTEAARLLWMAATVHESIWHAGDLSATRAFIRPGLALQQADTAQSPSWGPPFDRLFRTGPAVLMDSSTEPRQQLSWLTQQRPGLLHSLPSTLHALATECAEGGVQLPELQAVSCFAERLSPQVRAACKQAWGVPVSDSYGAAEVGHIARQCPDYEHYHVHAQNVLVEILDDAGEPCRAGEIGKVVVTQLNNFATPLLRYVIGDFAEAGESCPCGRGLPVIRRILGRERNIARSPQGIAYWPDFPLRNWAKLAPIRSLQLVQLAPDRMQVNTEAERELTAAERDAVAGALRGHLGHSYDLRFSGQAPQLHGVMRKFEEFINLAGD